MSTRRDGFTFIEMLLVMVLGLVLMAGAYGTLIRQEEGYRFMNARAETQEDTRIGIDMLSGEFREISAGDGDLLMATPDSLRIRALRKFGILCEKHPSDKKLLVAQVGADPFAYQDSLLIYVDSDSLTAKDDYWIRDHVKTAPTTATCVNTSPVASAMTGMPLWLLQVDGVDQAVLADEVFVGAPIRSFEILTYRTGDYEGEHMLLRRRSDDDPEPLFGPVVDPDGLEFRYFDAAGTELTSFPLAATDLPLVRRVQVMLRAERRTGATTTYTDSLVTEIFIRGG